MRINTNISAMNTYGRLTNANASKSNSLAKLSSGLRINKAGDDAAGLAISEKMKGQIGGLKQAVRNAQDGVSLIQTAEGALNETHSILGRMRDLAVQGSNGTLSYDDRTEIDKEFSQLKDELTRISDTTEFNTKKLLNSDGQKFSLQVGANSGQTMEVTINKMDAKSLGLDTTVSLSAKATDVADAKVDLASAKGAHETAHKLYFGDPEGADDVKLGAKGTFEAAKIAYETSDKDAAAETAWKSAVEAHELAYKAYFGDPEGSTPAEIGGAKGVYDDAVKDFNEAVESPGRKNSSEAIDKLDNAIARVSAQRSDLGAAQNRLNHTVKNLTTTQENLAEANSRIRDVDMAEEMMEFTKNNILSQAATSMLSQANAMPNSVLGLLQG